MAVADADKARDISSGEEEEEDASTAHGGSNASSSSEGEGPDDGRQEEDDERDKEDSGDGDNGNRSSTRRASSESTLEVKRKEETATDSSEDNEGESDEDDEQEDADAENAASKFSSREKPSDEKEAESDDGRESETLDNEAQEKGEEEVTTQLKKKRKVHKLSMQATADFNAQLRRRGVIYVARVPPRLTPHKIKRFLQDIAGVEVTRIYLEKEDASVRKRRRKEGGSWGQRYTEGWVELSKKRVAKHVAASLNNTPMTNVKRSPHYGDLWNLKYLPKFQWSHLTEKVAYERRVKNQKLRLETMQARRETAAYKQLVETGQKLDYIAERKRRRREATAKSGSEDDKTAPAAKKKKSSSRHQFQPVDQGAGKASHKSLLGSLVA